MKKYETIYRQFRQEILDGYRQKGERMPSIRSCVRQFHVSQTSVEHAYAQLQLEGYIRSRPQSGYYVVLSEESRALHTAMLQPSEVSADPSLRYDFRSRSVWSEEGELVLWKQYLKQTMNQAAIFSYGEARGEHALRTSLMRHASTMRGVLAHEEQLVIGASVQALLYQLCGLLPRNSRVAIQKGVYIQARRVFEDYGMEVHDVSFGEDRFDWSELKQLRPDVLFVHSPSLFEMEGFDLQACQSLLAWMKREGILLLEDDHNGELNYLWEGSMARTAHQLHDPAQSAGRALSSEGTDLFSQRLQAGTAGTGRLYRRWTSAPAHHAAETAVSHQTSAVAGGDGAAGDDLRADRRISDPLSFSGTGGRCTDGTTAASTWNRSGCL